MNEVMVYNAPTASCCGETIHNCSCRVENPTPLGLSNRIHNYENPLEKKAVESAPSLPHRSVFNYDRGELPPTQPIHRNWSYPNPLAK